jgi:hypothetical protein
MHSFIMAKLTSNQKVAFVILISGILYYLVFFNPLIVFVFSTMLIAYGYIEFKHDDKNNVERKR